MSAVEEAEKAIASGNDHSSVLQEIEVSRIAEASGDEATAQCRCEAKRPSSVSRVGVEAPLRASPQVAIDALGRAHRRGRTEHRGDGCHDDYESEDRKTANSQMF
jgi:hypothetical protein